MKPRALASRIYWRTRKLFEDLSPARGRRWLTGFLFDLRYGSDTNVVVQVADAEIRGSDSAHAAKYRAATIGFPMHVVRRLALECQTFDFVDLGSGKGRVLIEAAELPFHRVIGIELSPRLHATAQRLVASYEARRGLKTRIELQCRSATECEPPTSDTLYFLYNPFDATVLRTVLGHICYGIETNRARVIIAYLSPRWPEPIDELDQLRLIDHGRFGPDNYRVYATRSREAVTEFGSH